MKTAKAKHISEFNMNDWTIILRLVRQEIRVSSDVDLMIIEDAIIDMAFEKAKLLDKIEVTKDAKET